MLIQCPKWVQPRWVTLCLKYRDVAYTSRKSSQESRTLGDHLTIFISCVQVHVERAPQQNPKATGPGKELIRTVFPSPLVWLLPSSCPSRILHPLLSFFLHCPLHALILSAQNRTHPMPCLQPVECLSVSVNTLRVYCSFDLAEYLTHWTTPLHPPPSLLSPSPNLFLLS